MLDFITDFVSTTENLQQHPGGLFHRPLIRLLGSLGAVLKGVLWEMFTEQGAHRSEPVFLYRSLIEKGDGVGTDECVDGIDQRCPHALAATSTAERYCMCKSLVGWGVSWAAGLSCMGGDGCFGVLWGALGCALVRLSVISLIRSLIASGRCQNRTFRPIARQQIARKGPSNWLGKHSERN